jgi:hypothetical protein
MDKQKVKEILKTIWLDASKWGNTFGNSTAIDKWLDKKADEICQLNNSK